VNLLTAGRDLLTVSLKAMDKLTSEKQRVIAVNNLWSQVQIKLDQTNLYREFSRIGFEYGPSYRLIRQLGCTSTWSLAELDSNDNHASLHLDPGKVDAALQACLGIAYANQSQESAHLPFSIKSIKTYDSLVTARYVYVIQNPKIHHLAAYHVFFLNEEGKLIALMQDFIGRRNDRI
jgi:hypothetical protein